MHLLVFMSRKASMAIKRRVLLYAFARGIPRFGFLYPESILACFKFSEQ
jgi:hypothetical protein